MKKGDLVLTPFPFTDLSDIKQRPALVLIADTDDITLAFITSVFNARSAFDILLQPDATNRLKVPSLLRLSKLATIERSLIIGQLGSLSDADLRRVDAALLTTFAIPVPPAQP
jgi:mRNA interferase MazF